MLRLHGVLVLLLSMVFLGWGAAGAATPQRARGSCPAEPAEVRALRGARPLDAHVHESVLDDELAAEIEAATPDVGLLGEAMRLDAVG